WASIFRYAGINYNIATREVSLPESKRTKYLQTIADIREKAKANQSRYQLPDIERLHGQCQWAENIHTQGKWHVKGLQDFIRAANDQPALRHQWRYGGERIRQDMDWWEATLQQENFWRSFDPTPAKDVQCYCDGSTSFEVRARLSIRLVWVDTHSQKADPPSRGKVSSSLPRLPVPTMDPELHRWFKPKRWRSLLKDWKEKQLAKNQPRTEEIRATTPQPARPTVLNPTQPLATKQATGFHFTAPPKRSVNTRRFNPKKIQVRPTSNRPDDIKADERFATWKPANRTPSQSTSKVQDEQVRQLILSSFAKSTKKGYSTAVAQWNRFCDEHNVEESKRAPADPELVELWIAEAAGEKSGGYLSDWASALHAWHTLNNLPWLPDPKRLKLVKRGAKYTQPPPKPPRAPMTSDWLNKVIPAANLNDPKELATMAAATCGVWGLFRLAELVIGDEGFDPVRSVTRADVKTEIIDSQGKQILAITVRIPRTKVNRQGESVVLVNQPPPSDPVGLLTLHTLRNPSSNPAQTPLFAYREEQQLVPLTRQEFLTTIADIAHRVGAVEIHGHSMRIGGCTTLLKKGMPPDRVMVHGRWDSNTWKRYVREHAEVLAPYLATELQATQDR
ncbi:hypothetical protein CF328_g8969, partial [Tilletia controversa]